MLPWLEGQNNDKKMKLKCHLKLALLNTRSLNNKSLILNYSITWIFSVSLKPGPTPLVTAIIYRPPTDFLTQLSAISPSILLLGDFNIHIDTDCKSATEFLELLHYFNFTQHVNFPTHSRGHILDLVYSTGLTIHHFSNLSLNISNHLASSWTLTSPFQPLRINGQYLSETSNPSPL
ncbi:hypothetical protein D5F01_LYC03993 [Larimichthys crocea]|uniref:Endonuclease/exonuclease/phosphatase domain-containing protein n=1 Tax=Larimichthys crocea TaxID=215358 RepID=A0A6G0J0T0_LARCR|nr:hypothetical protein D5F01_LYC03993 [Larimichthys crocea]